MLNHVKGRFKDPYKQYAYIKGHPDRDGYLCIHFNGHPYKVHRLVAECFIPNPEGKETVDHIDHNRANNAVSNLRWATRREQALNRIHKYDFQYTDQKSYRKAYYQATAGKLHQRRR